MTDRARSGEERVPEWDLQQSSRAEWEDDQVNDSRQEQRIVVGVDGSDTSLAALEWAARQAELTGSRLDAVTTWHWPASFGYPVPLAAEFDPAGEATKLLDGALESLSASHPGLEVRKQVEEGDAATVLVECSRGADLLVVGSRGHRELVGMLLGSVSQYCVTHARCPVLVLRA